MAASESVRHRPAAEAGVFLATFALIFVAMGALFAVDLFLAGLERSERRSEAHQLYMEGLSLSRRRRRAQAVDRFQGAVAAERGEPVYQRALASALLAAGKSAEARAVVADRLQHEPTDAAASLIMARILVQQQKPDEAISYYHRAIYGNWGDGPPGRRVQARFELVDLLAKMGGQRELLGELLPLEDEAPADVTTRRRIARLFLDAGAPARSIEILRELLREHGRDADTYAGLGEAELARGNYRSAAADLSAAAALAPADSAIARRLALIQQAIALDPTQRGLGSDDQYRRSVALLRLTVQAADSCLGPSSDLAGRALADTALAAVSSGAGSMRRHDAVERNIDLAERLWALRRKECRGPPTREEQPLALVLERVAQ
ncbi:MAG: tetratricopeptide repeat protein [Gemmatimonadales bacterium]